MYFPSIYSAFIKKYSLKYLYISNGHSSHPIPSYWSIVLTPPFPLSCDWLLLKPAPTSPAHNAFLLLIMYAVSPPRCAWLSPKCASADDLGKLQIYVGHTHMCHGPGIKIWICACALFQENRALCVTSCTQVLYNHGYTVGKPWYSFFFL